MENTWKTLGMKKFGKLCSKHLIGLVTVSKLVFQDFYSLVYNLVYNLEGGHSYTCGYEPIATSRKPRPKTEKGLAKKYF